ncbi:phenylalanine--tRNA ligase subunit alpha [Rhodovibrionaceae bacterium A322]
MSDQQEALRAEVLEAVAAATTTAALDEVRVTALGKKGSITALMKTLGQLAPEARKEAGKAINEIKQAVAAAIEQRKAELEAAELDAQLLAERIDVSLPTRPAHIGRVHPISQTMEELVAIFGEMGFSVAEGPHIEDDFHNFEALNIPAWHPARQDHDTFYLPAAKEGEARPVLRTHTSPVQIRHMETVEPPLRIIAPGRTFRADYDATHSPMFHQVEGLVIDKTTHMGHLKGTLIEFCRAYFDVDELPVRFRPSYFPFTEPSAEMDIGCTKKDGNLVIDGGSDWLEILGCGMVHPKVLAHCGIDPNEYQGFAFGMGIERIAMLKYGMPDLRPMYDSDLRWMKHFGFMPLETPSLVRGL